MKLPVLIILNLFVHSAFSQTGSVSGRLQDSATGKPIMFATVSLLKVKDTSLVTYRLSGSDGRFRVTGLPLNISLRLIISFSGYHSYRQELYLTPEHKDIRLDSLQMKISAGTLEEVIVMAERPPVVIKNDTIEFNASSFKTLPNALVEDLLKKLPGVFVDLDGNISVNGKPVNRILVDGKTFFGDDPKMATRNLPAYVIDKVQVVDDKEQLLRNGDDNLNNVGKVINLTFKKGAKKGWFGKVYAGAGSKERYEGGGIANIFRDTLQLSLLGYANNLNRPGFSYSDLMQAGGMSRSTSVAGSRSSNSTSGSGSTMTIGGVNFGGVQGAGGIASSSGAGFNLNHAPNSRQSLFAQYFYGNVLTDPLNNTDTKLYNKDTVLHKNTQAKAHFVTHVHNIGIGGKFNSDSVTSLQVTANFTIGLQDDDRVSNIASDNNYFGNVSNGSIGQGNASNTYYYRHALTYTKLSRTNKRRRLTIFHNLDVNNRYNDYTTNALTHYLYPAMYDSSLVQLRRESVPRTDAVVAFNYSEPVSKVATIRLGGRYEYGKLKSKIQTYNPDSVTHQMDVVNSLLSSDFRRESNRFYLNAGLEFRKKNITITPQLRYLFQSVNNKLSTVSAPVDQNTSDLLPGLSIAYKQFSFNYNRDIILPAYQYLIPVQNNTYPYFVYTGNTNLLATTRQNFSINYTYNNTRKSFSIGLRGSGGWADKEVIQAVTVDNKGIQTNTPVNAAGTKNFVFNYNINKHFKSNLKFAYDWNIGGYYSLDRGQLSFNGEGSFQQTWDLEHWAGFNLNFNNKVEFNSNGYVIYNFTKYTSSAYKRLDVVTTGLYAECIVRLPKHLIWQSSVDHISNGSSLHGVPSGFTRWNATLNVTMLKDEKGVLRISVFDILNKGNKVTTEASSNMLSVSRTNVLPRYVIMTFTYNIRAVGTKKKIGSESLLLF